MLPFAQAVYKHHWNWLADSHRHTEGVFHVLFEKGNQWLQILHFFKKKFSCCGVCCLWGLRYTLRKRSFKKSPFSFFMTLWGRHEGRQSHVSWLYSGLKKRTTKARGGFFHMPTCHCVGWGHSLAFENILAFPQLTTCNPTCGIAWWDTWKGTHNFEAHFFPLIVMFTNNAFLMSRISAINTQTLSYSSYETILAS